MGMGKEQPVSAHVATPDGWRRIGDLRAGDHVIGRDGKPTEVLGLFPQGVKDVYEFKFSDGSATRCGIEHLWELENQYRKKFVLSTRFLLEDGIRHNFCKTHPNGDNKYFLPSIQPVEFATQVLRIDPYLMGVLLTSSTLTGAQLSVSVAPEVARKLVGTAEAQPSGRVRVLLRNSQALRDIVYSMGRFHPLGPLNPRKTRRYIPREYLTASVKDRLSLLHGILDTRAHPRVGDSSVEYTTASVYMTYGISDLVRSLGGTASRRATLDARGEVLYRVLVRLPDCFEPFSIPEFNVLRKPNAHEPRRALESITKLDYQEESVCIRVAARDHLYLTDDYIPTHNTVSALTALEMLQLAGETAPALVLAPLRVCTTTWPDEAAKWEHLSNIKIVPVTGDLKSREAALKEPADIYTCNYQNLPWLVEHYNGGKTWPYSTVVADESTRLKSFRTRQGGVRARALANVAHTKIKRFINLTGTPAPNGLKDLWGQQWFIDAGASLGKNYTSYMYRWFKRTADGFDYEISHPAAEKEIYETLKELCLTVDPRDWFDIKEPIVKTIEVDMPRSARGYYEKLRDELIVQIENHTITAANAAVKTQKLLQIANGAAYTDPEVDDDGNPKSRNYRVLHDAKLDALESLVEEVSGAPLLVAYHFRSDVERLSKHFKQARVLDSDPATLKAWNAGKIPMLLAHPASAGHGLNLQDGGNILVFFGHNWNLEDRMQIIERIGPVRQLQAGYDRPVWIYNIVCKKTVDNLVLQRVESKKSVQELLLTAMKDN